ncbi:MULTISPECIES: hypothetical protein [unclassified Streptomyces]|uniref:hypothetical protein n=1 Tax=unclassified Streptomyces TaxID=2593676 RepID=UPI0022575791|nr:hypothetical protein [Streptomyces sp. NBC_00568]MCX4993286.1 hypothetical protein [Streptomyces sp. NBC_00568]
MESATFPHDLVQLQAAWCRTYDALAAPRPTANTALRRRLLVLSARLWWHPFWSGPGRMPAARMELRRQARAALGRGAEPASGARS